VLGVFDIMITIRNEKESNMGKVVEKVKVTNFKDTSKSMEAGH